MPPSDSATWRPGKRSGDAGPQPFAGGQERVDREDGRQQFEGRVGRGQGRPRTEAPVCRQTTVSVSSQAAKKGSQAPLKMEGRPQLGRELGEADRLEAPGRVGPHLGRGQCDVGQPGQLQRDDPIGVRPRPHLQVPVVEGAQAGETEVRVRRPRVHRAAEPRHQRGKAQRGPDAGAVHVVHAGVDVEAAGAHLVEAGRLHAPFVPGPADDGVQPDVGILAVPRRPRSGCRRPPRRPGAPRRPARPGRRPSKRSGGSMRWSSTEMTGTRIGRGSGSGSRVARLRRGRCRRLPREGDTIVSELVRPWGAHDHTDRGRRDRVGLLIGGDVVAGAAGTYPVTNPARPSEVVLDAPSTTAAQLDRAVAAARCSQAPGPRWTRRACGPRRRGGRGRRGRRREPVTWPAS